MLFNICIKKIHWNSISDNNININLHKSFLTKLFL